MGIKIDSSDFDKGFRELVEDAAPDAIKKGMFAAANAVLKDAIYEMPFAPFDEGHLRGSARVDQVAIVGGKVEVDCGFNIEYAARWHELSPEEDERISWTLPGSGRKYLETKMSRNARRYLEVMGEKLKELLGG